MCSALEIAILPAGHNGRGAPLTLDTWALPVHSTDAFLSFPPNNTALPPAANVQFVTLPAPVLLPICSTVVCEAFN